MPKILNYNINIKYCSSCGRELKVTIVKDGFSEYSGKSIYRLHYRCPKASDSIFALFFLSWHDDYIYRKIELTKCDNGSFALERRVEDV